MKSKATFDVSIREHKKIKGLDPKFKNQNLRDHMTDLELIFTMLGEASTTEIAKTKDARGFVEIGRLQEKAARLQGMRGRNLSRKLEEAL